MRFVIEDGDDHDRSRVVLCTINVHIVCPVESVVHDGGHQERQPPRVCSATDCAEVRLRTGCPADASGAPVAVTVMAAAGSDQCRCTDDQGSTRMFADHLYETPLFSRTAGAFEPHSVSVGGSAYGQPIDTLPRFNTNG